MNDMKTIQEIEEALPLRGYIVKAHTQMIHAMNHDTTYHWFDRNCERIHEATGLDYQVISDIFYSTITHGTYKELFDMFRRLGIYIPNDEDIARYREAKKTRKGGDNA